MTQETIIVQFTSQFTLSLGTPFVSCAIIVGKTTQHADTIGADHAIGTEIVGETTIGNTNTFDLSVASELGRTSTCFAVVENGAFSIGSTSIGSITRILTVTIDTDFIDSTITIS